MGRRSRKRAAQAGTRAERDAARAERAGASAVEGRAPPRRRGGRPGIDERPAPPWGRFPLSELIVLLGIVLMVWGLVSWDESGNVKFGAGLAVAALAGVELSLREHLAGFRSHTTLLSGVAAFAAVSVLAFGPWPSALGPLVLVGAAVFAISFWRLRELFKRRSGGLSFR